MKTFHTNQPYIPFRRHRLDDGREVLVSGWHMAQTWDCQPIRVASRIREVDGREPTPAEQVELSHLLF